MTPRHTFALGVRYPLNGVLPWPTLVALAMIVRLTGGGGVRRITSWSGNPSTSAAFWPLSPGGARQTAIYGAAFDRDPPQLTSATAQASTVIPIIISIMLAVQTPGINVLGMTMLLRFVVSFGFILPVNAPQNMIAYGTDTFNTRDFIRTAW